MKRDMDLVRKLALAMQDHPEAQAPKEVQLDGYSDEQIGHHLYLMLDGGLIVGVQSDNFEDDGPTAFATCLTWAGQDFADAARSDTTWNRAKATIKDKAITVGFGVLTQLLASIAKSTLGLP
jgi:hypothetical protein